MLSTAHDSGVVHAKMSLVRAFTTRRNKADVRVNTDGMLGRAASQRAGKPSVARAQISAPVALVSTSNALLNNAQPIPGTRSIQRRDFSASTAASSSGEESDSSVGSRRSNDTNLTDTSSVDCSSPTTPVEPNHLSCYFKPAVDTEAKRCPSMTSSLDRKTSHSRSTSASPSLDTPKIPQRVPSHSKRAHESVARQRSIRRMMSPEPSAREFSRTSLDMSGPSTPSIAEPTRENPFGSELSQLDEVAEEFSHVVRDAEADADAKVLRTFGLAIFSATDYMSEIQSLIYHTFSDDEPAVAWI